MTKKVLHRSPMTQEEHDKLCPMAQDLPRQTGRTSSTKWVAYKHLEWGRGGSYLEKGRDLEEAPDSNDAQEVGLNEHEYDTGYG